MNKLGVCMTKKSVSKAAGSRRAGISTSRLSELTLNDKTQLRADQISLIALAIDVKPFEVLKEVCRHLKLKR